MKTPLFKVLHVHKALADLLPEPLLSACEVQRVKKGERLFLAGAKPTHMFYVGRGEVVLERLGRQGDVVVLQRAREGFVGEASLQSACYHCDARVVLDAEITMVEIARLQAAMVTDAAFSKRWIDMLSAELKRLRLQCERLALNRVQDRLLHLIETEGQGGCLPLPAGLKSLAGQLGVTHEALYRCVAGMEKAGCLRRETAELRLPQGLESC
jgi:CRP-like cAMP-binding protein